MLVLKVYGKDLLRKDTEVFESQTGSWRIIRLNWNLIDLKEIVTAWLGWEAISKWQLWNQYCDFETLPVIDLEKSFRMIDCVGWATLCNTVGNTGGQHCVGQNTVLGAWQEKWVSSEQPRAWNGWVGQGQWAASSSTSSRSWKLMLSSFQVLNPRLPKIFAPPPIFLTDPNLSGVKYLEHKGSADLLSSNFTLRCQFHPPTPQLQW